MGYIARLPKENKKEENKPRKERKRGKRKAGGREGREAGKAGGREAGWQGQRGREASQPREASSSYFLVFSSPFPSINMGP